MDGITISYMAKCLGISYQTAARRIERAGIKPLTYEALYPPDTLDKIREAHRGRPKKSPPLSDK